MFSECKNLTTILVGSNWKQENILSSANSQNMFVNCNSLIGNDGTRIGTSIDKTNAHAGEGGYLTTDSYKIFYDLDADDGAENLVIYNGAITSFPGGSEVTLVNPTKKGYAFGYWTGTPITGLVNGTTASTVTIAESEVGNRIYTAHWFAPYAVVSNNTDVISEGVTGKTLTFKCSATKPDDAYDLNTADNYPDWMNSETSQITRVVFDKSFQNARPTSCHGWFFNFVALSEIVGMKEYLNTENVTYMQ